MKRKTRLVAALLTAGILCMAQGSQMIYAAEVPDTTEITEPGTATSSVAMTYTDEHGDYIPTDNFTVTIPKTLNINPKEDYVYDVNVQGTIDADRDVWVCTDDTVTLTLTDETLAATYGINKTQTVANTIDKIQYSSEEISDVEGYTQQGTIRKTSLDYEIEAEYTGTLNFYINVINEDNIPLNSVLQNGFTVINADTVKKIISEKTSEDVYNQLLGKYSGYLSESSLENTNAKGYIVTYELSGPSTWKYHDTNNPFMSHAIDIIVITSDVSKTSTVTNGKYYDTYKFTGKRYRTYSLRNDVGTEDWYMSSPGGSSEGSYTLTETDSKKIELYLSPRCKLKYE